MSRRRVSRVSNWLTSPRAPPLETGSVQKTGHISSIFDRFFTHLRLSHIYDGRRWSVGPKAVLVESELAPTSQIGECAENGPSFADFGSVFHTFAMSRRRVSRVGRWWRPEGCASRIGTRPRLKSASVQKTGHISSIFDRFFTHLRLSHIDDGRRWSVGPNGSKVR